MITKKFGEILKNMSKIGTVLCLLFSITIQASESFDFADLPIELRGKILDYVIGPQENFFGALNDITSLKCSNKANHQQTNETVRNETQERTYKFKDRLSFHKPVIYKDAWLSSELIEHDDYTYLIENKELRKKALQEMRSAWTEEDSDNAKEFNIDAFNKAIGLMNKHKIFYNKLWQHFEKNTISITKMNKNACKGASIFLTLSSIIAVPLGCCLRIFDYLSENEESIIEIIVKAIGAGNIFIGSICCVAYVSCFFEIVKDRYQYDYSKYICDVAIQQRYDYLDRNYKHKRLSIDNSYEIPEISKNILKAGFFYNRKYLNEDYEKVWGSKR